MKDERLARRHVVLLGIGHTNAHVLRMWKMQPIPDADLTCLSEFPVATYSGHLPAVLAGQIPEEDMQIDLVRLCASAGARLILDPVAGLDRDQQKILFANRPPVPFDVLSIGIGSQPSTEGIQIQSDSLVRIKPMQTFLARLAGAIDRVSQRIDDDRLRIAIVGGGVAGAEIAFCLPGFLKKASSLNFSLRLVARSNELLENVSSGLRWRVESELKQRDIEITLGTAVVEVTPKSIKLADGSKLPADLVILATGAVAPDLLSQLDLPLDERGFLQTDQTLQTTAGLPIFAVGDTGGIAGQDVPKSGVYAVRQGPILWENIQYLLAGKSLKVFRPQPSFLKLINQGNSKAFGEWKGISFQGRWAMRLKKWIDGRFMEKHAAKPMDDGGEMLCKGCGCKLGGDVLGDGLKAIPESASPGFLDDAVEVGSGTAPRLASTDFFSAPFVDAYLNGRVTALHCASDLIATGAKVQKALANVVLPAGDPKDQKRVLNDFLRGAREEFDAMGATIAGGHTIVGPRMEAGFTVLGEPAGSLVSKSQLRPGDQLVLTKPLGVGVLLAAQMRTLCKADDYLNLLAVMLQRQHRYVDLFENFQIQAGTDVTGFGLAGHLIEMLVASGISATIPLDQLPVLSGAEHAIRNGIESTLAPANRHIESKIIAEPQIRLEPRYSLLFDPQTCGGLLLGVSLEKVDSFIKNAEQIGFCTPTVIGEVGESDGTNALKID